MALDLFEVILNGIYTIFVCGRSLIKLFAEPIYSYITDFATQNFASFFIVLATIVILVFCCVCKKFKRQP